MTSQQAMLGLVLLALSGCTLTQQQYGPDPLVGPYAQKRVWAVAPLRNESGSLQADGLVLADHFARHLTNAAGIDVLPLNRTLKAMEAAQIAEINTPADARQLLRVLNADGLILGTISAYDPFDPPKLGVTIELFDGGRLQLNDDIDVRALSRAATDGQTHPYARGQSRPTQKREGVVSAVSAYFDAADADVRMKLKRYAGNRAGVLSSSPEDNWHRYRMSMDLYSEFVTYVMSWRLLHAETRRLSRSLTADAPQAAR